MCASEGCRSSHEAQPSIYKHADWALSSYNSKICNLRRQPRSLPGITEAIPFVPVTGVIPILVVSTYLGSIR